MLLLEHGKVEVLRNWRIDFFALWAVQFAAAAGFMVANPFVPLYIQELGVSGVREAAVWSGVMGATGGITLALASPFWGAIADRHGRKLMLERAAVGAAIFQAGMGLAGNVWHLVAMRTLQSVVSGVQSAAMALAACIVPRQALGSALGALQMAAALGSTVGPFVGGWMAAHFGYRPTFFATGAFLLVAGLLAYAVIHEDFTPGDAGPERPRAVAGFSDVLRVTGMPSLLLVITVARAASAAMAIAVPLILQEMAGGSLEVSGQAGLVAGLSAAAMALGAFTWGRLGDRLGQERVLLLCLVLSIITVIPQFFVQSPWHLAVGQMMCTLMLAGMLPASAALIGLVGPPRRQGVVYGAGGSALALGNAVGPTLAAILIGVFGTRTLFLGVGLLLIGLYVVVQRTLRALVVPHNV